MRISTAAFLLVLGVVALAVTVSAGQAASTPSSGNNSLYVIVYPVVGESTPAYGACIIPGSLAEKLAQIPSKGAAKLRIGDVWLNASLVAEGGEAVKLAGMFNLTRQCSMLEEAPTAYILRVEGVLAFSLPLEKEVVSVMSAESRTTSGGVTTTQLITVATPYQASSEVAARAEGAGGAGLRSASTSSTTSETPVGSSRLVPLGLSVVVAVGFMYLASLLIKKF
ncbi:MAG: hypothetical protein J7L55_05700 [Desulfurococcales archaeon]|nr:hypothetical protein [Desulfurococcales archaeon]